LVEIESNRLVLPAGPDAIYSIFCNAANSFEGLTTLKYFVNRGLSVNCLGFVVGDEVLSVRKRSALQVACWYNQVDIADFLLQAGAEVDTVAVEAAYHEDGRMVSLLCRHGMDTNASFLSPVSSSSKPLSLAVEMGLVRVAQILIENGADLNGERGFPLRHACVHGLVRMVRLLFRYPGLNVDLFTDQNLRAVIVAGHLDVLVCLQELAPHRTWLGAGVPLEAEFVRSALIPRRLDVLKYCLRQGCRASVNSSIALYDALHYGLIESAECLLEHGADPLDLEPAGGRTLLHKACTSGTDIQLLCRMVRHLTVVTDEQFVASCALPNFAVFNSIVDIVRPRLLADRPMLQRGLTSACKASALQNAGYLVELGADVTWQNNEALLALASSAERSISISLDQFARNQSSVIRGLSPGAIHDLYAAAIAANVEFMFALHDNGAPVPSRLRELLTSACTFGQDRVVQLLMSLGAKSSEPSPIAAAIDK